MDTLNIFTLMLLCFILWPVLYNAVRWAVRRLLRVLAWWNRRRVERAMGMSKGR